MSYGRNFKRFRLIKGKTVKELSDYLGIAESEYVRWELDDSEPNLPQLCMLAKLYNCTIDFLLDRES